MQKKQIFLNPLRLTPFQPDGMITVLFLKGADFMFYYYYYDRTIRRSSAPIVQG